MPDSRIEKAGGKWYRRIRMVLITLAMLLLVIVTVIPGVLRLMYRADSQSALGHAKSVRIAIRVTAVEQYGMDKAFCDISQTGGVAEGLYEKILTLSKAPGEFWVLQTDDTGYEVESFLYQEGEYTVWYQANPSTYKVYHESIMINTKTGN